jgi:hypothetical protein
MKRRKPIKATHYAKRYYEALGFNVDIVERVLFPPDGRQPIRFDLFGFGDMIAFKPQLNRSCSTIVHILQVTSQAHVFDRRAKILANETARQWVESGHVISVVGVKRGKKRGDPVTVTVRDIDIGSFEIRELSMDDFAESPPCA